MCAVGPAGALSAKTPGSWLARNVSIRHVRVKRNTLQMYKFYFNLFRIDRRINNCYYYYIIDSNPSGAAL